MLDFKFISVVKRKLITTFVIVILSSFVLSLYFLIESKTSYNAGNFLLQGTLFYGVYIGAIVFVYGNFVSLAIEYVQKRWYKFNNWIYILIHGLFGLANGLVFQTIEFAIAGMTVAVVYAMTDRWLLSRILRQKSLKLFLAIPILIIVFSWGVLQITSPTMPHFTKEDAVKFATNGEGTIIDFFPKEIGEKSEIIKGYEVIRETQVEEADKEVYFVTFIERWSSGEESGKWHMSYKVKRGQLTAYDQRGRIPPYR